MVSTSILVRRHDVVIVQYHSDAFIGDIIEPIVFPAVVLVLVEAVVEPYKPRTAPSFQSAGTNPETRPFPW